MTKRETLIRWAQGLPDDADIWIQNEFLTAGDHLPYCDVGFKLEVRIVRLEDHIWEIWSSPTDFEDTMGSRDEAEDFAKGRFPGATPIFENC